MHTYANYGAIRIREDLSAACIVRSVATTAGRDFVGGEIFLPAAARVHAARHAQRLSLLPAGVFARDRMCSL